MSHFIYFFLLWQPECSVLLDALEQSAFYPEIASILVKTLLRILQLSCEKTIASFKTLDAITLVLKVACIQAQEFRRSGNNGLDVKNNRVEVVSPQSCLRFDPSEKAQSCLKSMEASMDLLLEYISIADADDAEILVLRSSTCVDCLFDLFWEKTLRNRVLPLILDLMKVLLLDLICLMFACIMARQENLFVAFLIYLLYRLCHLLMKIREQSCVYVLNTWKHLLK